MEFRRVLFRSPGYCRAARRGIRRPGTAPRDARDILARPAARRRATRLPRAVSRSARAHGMQMTPIGVGRRQEMACRALPVGVMIALLRVAGETQAAIRRESRDGCRPMAGVAADVRVHAVDVRGPNRLVGAMAGRTVAPTRRFG